MTASPLLILVLLLCLPFGRGIFFESASNGPCVVLADSTTTKTEEADISHGLPLGIPFSFESSLFRGKALIRIRDCPVEDNGENARKKSEEYFRDRNRRLQIVVQGKFKDTLSMADLYTGDIYEKPMKPRPPKFLARTLDNLLRRLWPGVVMDLTADRPRMLRLYAGGAENFRVDEKGSEPDITERDIEEHSAPLGLDFRDSASRKRILSNPKLASKYSFDPSLVYTFHCYDEVMDLSTYQMVLPMLGKVSMNKLLSGQVFKLRSLTKGGRDMFSFPILHKSMLAQKYSVDDNVSHTSQKAEYEPEIQELVSNFMKQNEHWKQKVML